jgi:sugar phosphate isomerase/epimerase
LDREVVPRDEIANAPVVLPQMRRVVENFSFSGDGWDDLAGLPLEQIAYIQFADALSPATTNLTYEALNRRAMPGDGVLELDRFTSTVRQRGFDGVVSVQVLSAELRRLPLPDFARRAHDAAARYWTG